MTGFQAVTYYTKGTVYEEIVKGLVESADKMGVPLKAYAYNSKGSWVRNLRLKPQMVLTAMQEFPDKDILEVDCDARFRKYPILFDNYDFDLACLWLYWWDQYPQKYRSEAAAKRPGSHRIMSAGTIWMRNTPAVAAYVKYWQELLHENPTEFDQEMLQVSYTQAQRDGIIKVADSLPPEYCAVCLPRPPGGGYGKLKLRNYDLRDPVRLPIDESIKYEDVVIEHGRSTNDMIRQVR